MSKKSKGVDSDTRREVLTRAYFACERCNSRQNGLNIHHRTPRGMGGSRQDYINRPANLIALCGSGTTGCHGWVESNREEAFNLGLLVRRGFDPELVPMVDLKGNCYFIYNDGTKYQIIEPTVDKSDDNTQP